MKNVENILEAIQSKMNVIRGQALHLDLCLIAKNFRLNQPLNWTNFDSWRYRVRNAVQQYIVSYQHFMRSPFEINNCSLTTKIKLSMGEFLIQIMYMYFCILIYLQFGGLSIHVYSGSEYQQIYFYSQKLCCCAMLDDGQCEKGIYI